MWRCRIFTNKIKEQPVDPNKIKSVTENPKSWTIDGRVLIKADNGCNREKEDGVENVDWGCVG